MARLHTLIQQHGRQAVLDLPDFQVDRRVLDAAAGFLSTEGETGFLFSGWAYTPLPHRRLSDDQTWTVRTEQASVLVQPGLRVPLEGEPVPVGVPYGSRARLILLYLQTQAVKNQSREVELGRSLSSWLQRMNIPKGGKSIADVRDQADRIARCRMTFQFRQGSVSGLVNQHILEQAIFNDTGDGPSSALLETAKLSEGYYDQLKRHPLPVDDAAIRQISNNSMALDLYIWLGYRLHALQKPTHITWKALQFQFGLGFGRLDNFKLRLRENLSLALAVYPEAEVEEAKGGLTLKPSRPPIAPRVAKPSLLGSTY
jgi:hypothetical protein